MTILFFAFSVPPIRSGIPDFGPDKDFFGQTGPEFCRKSGVFKKNIVKITHEIGSFWHLLNESANVNFTVKVLESLDFSTESGYWKMVQIFEKMVRI